jgi:glycosyltransferase involved in cell wall biosynthesis
MLKIHYQGLLKSTASWAHVNRQLILALDRAGCDVSVTGCKGFLYDPGYQLPRRITGLLDKPRNRDYEIALEYPANYHRIQGKVKAGILFYESTELPPEWAQGVLKYLDRLFVPSTFCRDIMVKAGIPADLVSIKRKGTRELVRAFISAFTGSDNVALVLKTTYNPQDRLWETESVEALVKNECKNKADIPWIKVINRPEPENRIASYLTACDAYVQPSYSEGFGLVILEAMACAKPVITIGWSAPVDFCTRDNSFWLNYTLIPAGDMQYDYPQGKGQVAQPDLNQLAVNLKEVYGDQKLRDRKAQQALADSRDFTWERSAGKIMQTLKDTAG